MKKNQIASIFLIIVFLITSVYFSDKLSNDENVNLSEIIQTETQLAQSSFVPSANQYEIEAGSVSSPMTISTDSNASDGKYVVSNSSESGEVNLNFTVDKTENYYIWGRVLSQTYSMDSFYVSVDGGVIDIWDTAENTWSPNWQWTRVTGRIDNNNAPSQNNANPRVFSLSSGQHNIKFTGREPGAKLDKIVITNDPNFVPTDSVPTIIQETIVTPTPTPTTVVSTLTTSDTIPPQIPINLALNSVSKTNISISWTRSTDNVKVTGYKVYRDGIHVSTPSRNTFNDSNRTPGTKYIYTIAAVDSSGNVSAQSSPLEVTTVNSTSPTFIIGDSVTTKGPTNVYSSASTNRTLLGTQKQGAVGKITVGPTWNSNNWWWKVNFNTGVDGWVIESYIEKSTSTSVSDTTSPSTPSPLSLSSVTQNQASISWANSTDNVGVTGYKVFRNGTQISTVTTNTYTDSSLISATTYTYNVSAFDAAGNSSALSSGLIVTTSTTIPTNYTLSVTKSGTGSGTVSGGNISCGNNCSQTSVSGTTVTLTATPASGSTFSGWSGACTGTGSCSVNLTSNVSIGAAFTLSVITTPPTTGTVWYAAPNGTASGNGSITSPWDLKTALAGGNGKIQPGHTLYLRGGTYIGVFESKLQGTESQPIRVRNYQNERATLDGNVPGLSISTQTLSQTLGGYVWYQGFEVMNSNPQRVFTPLYVSAPDGRAGGVSILAPGVKLINLVVHDASDGISAWVPATNFEAYGNVIYNSGWEGPNGYNGHGIYSQNSTTQKLFENNISFNNFKFSAQLYGKQANLLNNFLFKKNIFFNPSTILFGGSGSTPLKNITFDENYLFNNSLQIGYVNSDNSDINITNNYINITGDTSPVYTLSKNVKVTGNTIINTDGGQLTLIDYNATAPNIPSDYIFNNNIYYTKPSSDAWFYVADGGSQGICRYVIFNDPTNTRQCSPETAPKYTWQGLGYDLNSIVIKSIPTQTKIFINKKDSYDPNRSNIAIYNPSKASSVLISNSSLQGVLSVGDAYELHSVLDYYADVKMGVYTQSDYSNGGITVSMLASDHTVAKPIGFGTALGPNTFPDFGAFVLIKK